MKTTRHEIKTSERSGSLTITETPDLVSFDYTFDRIGPLGDELELIAHSMRLQAPYYGDPRPFRFTDPVSGDRVTIIGDEQSSISLIEPGPPRGPLQ